MNLRDELDGHSLIGRFLDCFVDYPELATTNLLELAEVADLPFIGWLTHNLIQTVRNYLNISGIVNSRSRPEGSLSCSRKVVLGVPNPT